MSRLRGFMARLGALFARRRFERELDEELRFHEERETEAGLAHGLDPAAARRRARLAFGGADAVRESVREARGLAWLDDLRSDVRYALRSLGRNRAFAVVAVLTLGLGIGAATSVYSVVDGVLLRPLPWTDADRLAVLWEYDRVSGTEREAASQPDFVDFRERSRAFERVVAVSPRSANFGGAGDAQRVRVAAVTDGFFAMLGVAPVRGRFFDGVERTGEPLAVVSEELWRTALGGSDAAVGSSVRIDDVAYTVVAIAPAGLQFPESETAVWVPHRLDPATAQRSRHDVMVFGRLAPGATVAAAQTELTSIAEDLEAEYASNRGRGVFVEPVREAFLGTVRPALLMLLGAVVLVLLVACVNVASLLLARGTARSREIAIRGALGAGGGRLARQFTVESLVLAVSGGVAGIVLARLAVGRLVALAPTDLPRAATVGVDGRVLFAALAVTVAVGLVFGLVPVHQGRRVDLQSTLREEGRSGSATLARQRFRSGLVIVEIALAVVLLVGAGLLGRSLLALQNVDPGFRADHLLKVEYVLPPARYPQVFADFPEWTEVQRFHREVRDRIAAIPGVDAVGLGSQHPLNPGFTNSFVIEGREEEYESQPEIATRPVDTGYLNAAGIPLLSGRMFDGRDASGSPQVILLNQAAAERFFPDTNPVGSRIRFWGQAREVVGIVGNERFQGLGEAAPPALYAPLTQAPLASGSILIRTSVPPAGVADQVRGAIAAVDPDLAIFAVTTMDDALRASLSRERFATILLALFAGAGLLLALVGVHGLLSYTVAQRTRELGIRMALGASRGELVRMVVGRGLTLATAGLALGLLGALAAAGALRGMLFGVAPTDPATFALVAGALLATALLACLSPARRATAADPMHALRTD